jgi:hypothetical protein
MTENPTDAAGKVVYLRPADARAAKLRQLAADAADATRAVGAMAWSILILTLAGLWQVLRLVLCALLVLVEPMLRMTLVPLAFLSFVVTLIFGFLIGDPRFPKWGMLAFSVGVLWLYWLFVALMSLIVRGPRGTN